MNIGIFEPLPIGSINVSLLSKVKPIIRRSMTECYQSKISYKKEPNPRMDNSVRTRTASGIGYPQLGFTDELTLIDIEVHRHVIELASPESILANASL